MIIEKGHLTYCTNIHPGETWNEVFESLKEYSLSVKKEFIPNQPFGIGLRLSRQSATELLEGNNLVKFKAWLDSKQLYVFTMNGFPYGDFHHVEIKDKVHLPDWTTKERVAYTKDLMKILAFLLPEGMEGGVSTSPISYKLWFDSQAKLDQVKLKGCLSLMEIVIQLVEIKKNTGKNLHLDLEPEPDGIIENTQEVIDFFRDYLLKEGIPVLRAGMNCTTEEAKRMILNHIQICYDVCHFALAFEKPNDVIEQLHQQDIKIGKIQISAALKCLRSKKVSSTEQQECLRKFDEPTYLHQSAVRFRDGSIKHFPDLKEGIVSMSDAHFEEIRTHFHVPVFVSEFEVLESTQDDIVEALNLWKEKKYSAHLEVETYTWAVLPENLQTTITRSIVRELHWVSNQINEITKP